MADSIGSAGLAAARMAGERVSPLMSILETRGRTDWPRLAEALVGPGERLDETVRGRMEGMLGSDLGEARVHSGPQMEPLARHLGAEAFTIGSRVFAPAGDLNLGTERGAGLLAHELTHVAQQSQPRQSTGPPQQPGGSFVQRTASEAAESEARSVEQAARRSQGAPESEQPGVDVEMLAERVYQLMRLDILLGR